MFALLAIEDLDVDDALRTAIATLAMTVLLSVILHGLTADVFAARYGAWIDPTHPPTETAAATEPRPRRSLVPWHHRHSRHLRRDPPADEPSGPPFTIKVKPNLAPARRDHVGRP